jgi:hypothetical protein
MPRRNLDLNKISPEVASKILMVWPARLYLVVSSPVESLRCPFSINISSSSSENYLLRIDHNLIPLSKSIPYYRVPALARSFSWARAEKTGPSSILDIRPIESLKCVFRADDGGVLMSPRFKYHLVFLGTFRSFLSYSVDLGVMNRTLLHDQ